MTSASFLHRIGSARNTGSLLPLLAVVAMMTCGGTIVHAQVRVVQSSFSTGYQNSAHGSIWLTSIVGEPFVGMSAGGQASVLSGFAGALVVSKSVTSASLPEDGIPFSFALHQNFPNPFNPTTTIQFDLPNRTDVVLRLYSLLGQLVRTIDRSEREAGVHVVRWDGLDDAGRAMPTGTYVYRLHAGDFVQAKRLLLLR